jgi:hypothetical protein
VTPEILPGLAFVVTFSLLVTARYLWRNALQARVERFWHYVSVSWKQMSAAEKMGVGLWAAFLFAYALALRVWR